jgi:putative ABC transport system permease protein
VAAAAGSVDDVIQLYAPHGGRRVRLLAVDPVTFGRLLDATPGGGSTDLARLGASPADGSLPALVEPGVAAVGTSGVSVRRDDVSVRLAVVGTVSRIVGGAPAATAEDLPTVLVDAVALSTVSGRPVLPNTLWVVGPGAEDTVAALPASPRQTVLSRGAWLAEHRAAPLTEGLVVLRDTARPVLLLFGLLVVVLAAAAGAPGRRSSLALLSVLGVGRGQLRRIAWGELLPPVLAACPAGVAIGAVLTSVVAGPLDLRILTGQRADPAAVVPWWTVLVMVPPVLTVLVVAAAEGRRQRLRSVLRVGDR